MATSFDWQDPLKLDLQLSDDERAVRDAARKFAQVRDTAYLGVFASSSLGW